MRRKTETLDGFANWWSPPQGVAGLILMLKQHTHCTVPANHLVIIINAQLGGAKYGNPTPGIGLFVGFSITNFMVGMEEKVSWWVLWICLVWWV